MKAGFHTSAPATARAPKAADRSTARVQRELQKLREENELLRDSACFFGELAERLAKRLSSERARSRRGTRTPTRR
jgi:hypothetical protein